MTVVQMYQYLPLQMSLALPIPSGGRTEDSVPVETGHIHCTQTCDAPSSSNHSLYKLVGLRQDQHLEKYVYIQIIDINLHIDCVVVSDVTEPYVNSPM